MVMKRAITIVFVLVVLLAQIGISEEISIDGLTLDELLDLRERIDEEIASFESEDEADSSHVITATVSDYVGLNLESCGYTSMGGERRDRYADATVLLVLQSIDGEYIDPNDEQQLLEYTVIAQNPAPGTPFDIITYPDEGMNLGYEEIVLYVKNIDDQTSTVPQIEDITPSPNRDTQYVRDYVGRSLENVGYIALNGNRYDSYGPDGIVKIITLDEEGYAVNIEGDYAKYYFVTAQDQAPNTEMAFTYSGEDDAEVVDQSVDVIEVTVAMSEKGETILAENEAREEELRNSGALTDLYPGTYEVGADIEAGCYELAKNSEACSVYTYLSEDDLYNSDYWEWYYLSSADEKAFIMLKDGMYIKVQDSIAKSIKSDVDFSGNEFMLFSGVYYIGTDIESGKYELSLVSDSCNMYTYENETSFDNDDGSWNFLSYDDTEYVYLREGMILSIKGGALNAKIN
jgi:hypothetical protein